MPTYFPENNAPLATDQPGRSLQKIVSLLVGLPAAFVAYFYPRKSTIWVPARAMTSRTTSGAATGSTETTTNKVMLATLDFDKDSDEFAQFTVALPKSWDGTTDPAATLSVLFFWTCAAGVGGADKTVKWMIQGGSTVDGDVLDLAFGSAVGALDTWQADEYLHVTSEVANLVPEALGGNPNHVVFQVYRDASEDNLAGDARLLGVQIFFNESTYTDA